MQSNPLCNVVSRTPNLRSLARAPMPVSPLPHSLPSFCCLWCPPPFSSTQRRRRGTQNGKKSESRVDAISPGTFGCVTPVSRLSLSTLSTCKCALIPFVCGHTSMYHCDGSGARKLARRILGIRTPLARARAAVCLNSPVQCTTSMLHAKVVCRAGQRHAALDAARQSRVRPLCCLCGTTAGPSGRSKQWSAHQRPITPHSVETLRTSELVTTHCEIRKTVRSDPGLYCTRAQLGAIVTENRYAG